MATVDVVAEGFVPKVPVIPAGHPVGANSTTELKPFAGTTLTVEVPGVEAVAVAVLAVNVKLGAAATVIGMLVLDDKAPLVPFTGSV